MNKQESNSTVKKKKRKKRGTLKIEPGISAHPFKLSSRNVLDDSSNDEAQMEC